MRRAFAALFVLAACTPVQGVGTEPQALVTIHGRLSRAPSELAHPRAAILWAGVPVFVQYCHDYGPTPRDPDRQLTYVASKGCRDPFEVVPGQIGPTVAIDPGATTFEIGLEHLPDASVMVGTLEQRVAYGSLVLFDDTNDNERLNLTGGCPRRRRGEMMRPPDEQMPPPRDALLAASFVKLTSEQTRIAYVEGDFDAESFFYPHPSCTELPPRGFSIWHVGDMLDPNAGCSVKPIDEEIVLQLDAQDSLLDLSCVASERDSFPRPPPDEGTPEDVIFDCLPDGTLVTADPMCTCPNLRQYALRGCFDDAACTTPNWDVKAPEGWPCSQP